MILTVFLGILWLLVVPFGLGIAPCRFLPKEYRMPGIFISGYGNCHINREKVACDYSEFLDSQNKPQFFGEYMQEYSWAEETAAHLQLEMQQSKYE